MASSLRALLSRVTGTVRRDLRRDPYLRYVLLLALVACGFWFWWRAPSFATADEYGRLLRPMKAAGYFFADPGFESFRRGATDGLAQGATFYLYALTAFPVFVWVAITGQLGEFSALAGIESRWTLWQAVPAWFWTANILIARLVNVVAAVAAVYVTYRVGTQLRDRATGRAAALLLTLSLGFIASAHEANEDTVAVLLLLAVLSLSIRYVRTGEETLFLVGCALGGLAIAFKLTAGVSVFFLGVAFLLRAHRSGESWRALARPRLLGLGLLTGVVVVYAGMPNVLLAGPDELLVRVSGSLSSKTQKGGVPPFFGYPVLFGLLNAVGLPLVVGFLAGTVVCVSRLRGRLTDDAGRLLLLVGLAVYLGVFLQWSQLQPHHLLPTIPLFALLLAGPLTRWYGGGGRWQRLAVAGLVLSTALYAGMGTLQYASDPRDEAIRWLGSEAGPDDEITVYENSIAQVAVPHGYSIDRYDFVEEVGVHDSIANESDYTEWMVATPERRPAYVQFNGGALRYLDPDSPASRQYPRRGSYVRDMFAGRYDYEVAAEFGERRTARSPTERLLRAGIDPEVEKVFGHVIVFRRTA